MYAQAVSLYKSEFRHWFNQEEIKEINANNEQYQLRSPEEELLLTWFEPVEKEVATHFLNASQIAQIISSRANMNINDATVNKLGKALKKHQFHRIYKNRAYVYIVKLREYEEVDRENKHFEEENTEVHQQQKIPFRFEN